MVPAPEGHRVIAAGGAARRSSDRRATRGNEIHFILCSPQRGEGGNDNSSSAPSGGLENDDSFPRVPVAVRPLPVATFPRPVGARRGMTILFHGFGRGSDLHPWLQPVAPLGRTRKRQIFLHLGETNRRRFRAFPALRWGGLGNDKSFLASVRAVALKEKLRVKKIPACCGDGVD